MEESEQLEFLRALGCDRAQGFHISRPVVPGAIAALYGCAALPIESV